MKNDTDDSFAEDVWPPVIAYPPLTQPVCLTEVQLSRIRYRWFYVAACLMACAIGPAEYFSSSHGWWHFPMYKEVFAGICLFGFGGNLWRAIQGWQLKAVLDHSRE